jgi:muramidase (phage lysozyme)
MNKENRNAFLMMIKKSEGTYKYGEDGGYNVIVGGTLFNDYSKHPNVKVYLPRLKIYSTAAGAYQLLHRYWVAYCKQLDLHDFSPITQDLIAIQQIKECKALDDIDAGRFDAAVHKCRRIWASLPNSMYGQHTNTLEFVRNAYVDAGGKLA